MARILLIEDHHDLAEPTIKSLREDGFEVGHAPDGQSARRLLEEHWDIVLLDLMLPDISGESLLTYLRQRPTYPNVLVLTAKTGLEDKLALFRLGCDDFLTKPFVYDELLERIRALLRRAPRTADVLQYADLKLDPQTFRLSSAETEVLLTPKESAICRLLMTQPEVVVSRRDILHGVWGLPHDSDSNFIGVHTFNLRKKFAQLGRGEWFQTVRSSGYVIRSPEHPA